MQKVNLENLVKRFHIIIKIITNFIVKVITKIYEFCKKTFNIILVSNETNKTIHFHISGLFVILLSTVVLVLFIIFFIFVPYLSSSEKKFNDYTNVIKEKKYELSLYEEEIKKSWMVYDGFMKRMNQINQSIKNKESNYYYMNYSDIEKNTNDNNYSFEENDNLTLIYLKELSYRIKEAEPDLDEIYYYVNIQREFLRCVPSLWPVILNNQKAGVITEWFGWGKSSIGNYNRFHTGIDIAYTYNTPIIATAEGVIKKIDYSEHSLGKNILIEHKYGYQSRYGHLNMIIVKQGQKIKQGQVIGYMGSTGISTGTHLHYEILLGNSFVDPTKFVNTQGIQINMKSKRR